MSKDGPVVVVFNNPYLLKILMDHLVKESVTIVTSSEVKVFTHIDGRGVAEVAIVPLASSYPNGDSLEDTAEVLIVKLIEPLP